MIGRITRLFAEALGDTSRWRDTTPPSDLNDDDDDDEHSDDDDLVGKKKMKVRMHHSIISQVYFTTQMPREMMSRRPIPLPRLVRLQESFLITSRPCQK